MTGCVSIHPESFFVFFSSTGKHERVKKVKKRLERMQSDDVPLVPKKVCRWRHYVYIGWSDYCSVCTYIEN